MRKPVEFATGLRRGVSGKLFKALKLSYQVIRRPFASPERVLFIVGCPRSGTTLLHDLLDGEFDIRIYGERSPLTSHDTTDHIKLHDLRSVRSTLGRAHARMVVVKPLVEPQNTPQLLAECPIRRHYSSTVTSATSWLRTPGYLGFETAFSTSSPSSTAMTATGARNEHRLTCAIRS